jgi:hypothetical protein
VQHLRHRPDPSYGTGAIVYHAEVNPMPKAGGKWSTMEITAKGRDLSIMFDGSDVLHTPCQRTAQEVEVELRACP